MAILAIIKGKGLTKNMYETIRKEIKWEQNHPKGGTFHVSGFDHDGNMLVVDVWESQAAMDEFFKTRLAPAMQKLKIPMPEAVEVVTTHNINAYPSMDQYKLAPKK